MLFCCTQTNSTPVSIGLMRNTTLEAGVSDMEVHNSSYVS